MKIIKPNCWICGKKFGVKIASTKRIMTKCFYSSIHPELWGFRYWGYQMDLKKKDKNGLYKTYPEFKNRFWRVVGLCKFTRDIIYGVWRLIKLRRATDYWECPKCCSR